MNRDEDARRQYLDAIGIEVWLARGPRAQPANDPAPAQDVTQALLSNDSDEIDGLGWDDLRARVLACMRCGLHERRTQAVFGVGDAQAQWMIIGEAPGAEEDRLGEPFVGRAGKLLNNMLLAIGLKRGEVYIANIVKCRPPGNRDPQAEEAQSCAPYLARQIALIQPKIILAVGRVAAQNLLNTDRTVGALRGKEFRYANTGIPVIVTYHPAYLLRSPQEKRKAWDDLRLARRSFAAVTQ